jgi:hypothetical protein
MKSSVLGAFVGAVALAASMTASASVISFGISGTYSQGGGLSDLAAPFTATTVGLGGAGSFTLDPGASGRYFDFKKPGGGTFATTSDVISGYFFLRSYADGDLIGATTFTSHSSRIDDWDTILVNDVTAGVWGASHSGNLAFETLSGLYGWVGYDFTRVGTTSTIEFTAGAYNDTVGGNLLAGPSPVPEPAALALAAIGLLAAGARRRVVR